jgi:Ca2+-binding EF-hand superfamily protein
MQRLIAMTALCAAAGCPALGQPPPAAPAAPPPILFLSPSGEPFRKSPAMPDPLEAWFDRVDAKHQGYIDREEFRADAQRFFKVLDENGDGVIDGFEVADYEHKIAPELIEWLEGRAPGEFEPKDRAKGHGPDQPHEKRGPAPRAIAQLIYEPEPVSGADLDLDSHITLAEWMQATDRRFDILDSDKTGRLTLAALRAKLTGPTLIRR